MADPLHLLRDYLINRKKINEVDGLICFGDIGFPRQVATNFAIWGRTDQYYTLEALYFFAQCCERELQHPNYVREAAKLNVNLQVVTRPDRKSVQEYLTQRDLEKLPPSISSSRAPPVPTHLTRQQIASFDDRKRGPGDLTSSQGSTAVAGDAASGTDVKRARIDEPAPTTATSATVDDPMDGTTGKTSTVDTSLADGVDRLRMTRQRERVWTTRNSMLMISASRTYAKSQSTASAVKAPQVSSVVGGTAPQQPRTLYKSIVSTLHMLKQKHDASKQPRAATSAQARQLLANGLDPETGMPIEHEKAPQAAGYSRYDQEKFRTDKTVAGFQINQSTTFVGGMNPADTGNFQPKPVNGVKVMSTHNVVKPAEPAKGTKKLSRTPIIIIPASSTSLITMMNARSLLQDLKYLTPQEARQAGKVRVNEDKIERRVKGDTIVYRIVDNPLKLTDDEWQRVVAVFAQGPLWQFKNWKLCLGEPVMLFQKICAFHLKYEDTKLDSNISKWAVHTLSLHKQQKHQHRATLMSFWSVLDKFVNAHPRLKNSVKHP